MIFFLLKNHLNPPLSPSFEKILDLQLGFMYKLLIVDKLENAFMHETLTLLSPSLLFQNEGLPFCKRTEVFLSKVTCGLVVVDR